MALSFGAVKRAYEVFNELSNNQIPDLSIGAFPEDISNWDDKEFARARKNL